MNIEQRTDEAVKFFAHLWPGKPKLAQAELHNRGVTNDFHEGKRRFRAFGMSLEIHLEEVMTKADRGVEMFYCPTPMSGDSGRKKYQVEPSVVAFSDADYGLSDEAKARMEELGACLVRSGGKTEDGRPKYHIYLRLSRPVGLDELEKINRGLKAFVNGDKFDATSLLRVPGTRNHKYPGKPLVRVERYADQAHDPDTLSDMFPVPKGVIEGVALEGLKLPEIPDGFRFTENKPGYFKVRRVVREWNGRFQDSTQTIHRYAAAIAIVKETIKAGLSVDVAYAFADHCLPLIDKQAEENGYSIQKDIAKTYYRETKVQSSGMTVEDFTREADQRPAVKEKDRPTPPPAEKPRALPPSSTDMPNLGKSFPFRTPNLDELLAGDYKPLEPTLVPCGPYFLLYPGKSHGISSDRGLGKTNVTIAMVHQVMKQGGRVVYFDYEDSPDTFIRDRMMNQHGITEEMIRTQFLYFNGVEMMEAAELDMDSDEDSPIETLTEAIVALADAISSWDLVVIDGVTNAMSDWSIEKDTTGDKPGNFLDGNKAVDYLWWHRRHIKPFLDRGIATFQIDHTNKTGGNRVGGTGQKGAKFTGIEYELRAEKNGSLVMGGTGKLLLSVAKDRIGRVLRFKRKRSQENDDSDAFDVARFTMTSDIEGRVTRATFDPIDQEVAGHDAEGNIQGPTLSDREKKALDIIQGHSGPLNKTRFRAALSINSTAAGEILKSLQAKGLIDMVDGSRGSQNIVPIQGAPTPHEPGKAELDFSKADYVPARARSRRECRKCREHHDYPSEFAQPDDLGYMPNRPMCKPCAADPIDSEPSDGPEWARGIRERITGRRRKRGESERS